MIGVKKDVKSQRKVAFKDFPLAFLQKFLFCKKMIVGKWEGAPDEEQTGKAGTDSAF